MPQMRHTLLQNHPNMLIVQRIEHGFALLAVFYKIFGDATRIRILQTLLEGERNVGDLADVLEMSQSAVSHPRKS